MSEFQIGQKVLVDAVVTAVFSSDPPTILQLRDMDGVEIRGRLEHVHPLPPPPVWLDWPDGPGWWWQSWRGRIERAVKAEQDGGILFLVDSDFEQEEEDLQFCRLQEQPPEPEKRPA